MSEFRYFLDIIPPDMYSRTKSTICQHIAIFEPKEYSIGEVFYVDDYHFILFLGKPPDLKISNVEYKVRKGDLVVIQPWVEFCGVHTESREYGKYLHIAVKTDFFKSVSEEAARGEEFKFKRIQGRYSDRLLDLIGSFQQEMMNYGDTYQKMILSLSTQIVFQLLRDLEEEPAAANKKTGRDNPYISEAISLMQQYYSTNISINDISNLIYLSPCHFKRVFKEYTGQTPHRYLMDIRFGKARELMKNSEYSIEDIARQCGFVNPGHFTVAFKRATRLSPSEYRKKYA